VLLNANVITMDEKDTRAKAIAIRGDRILKVGSESEVKKLSNEDTEVMDLAGRTIIPGLMDTHMHTGKRPGFDAAWIPSIKELQEKLALYAMQVPKGTYIRGNRNPIPDGKAAAIRPNLDDNPRRLVTGDDAFAA
jgi:predicted amidohydrolase YtcJ